jgi:hypothetical protein
MRLGAGDKNRGRGGDRCGKGIVILAVIVGLAADERYTADQRRRSG